MLVSKRLIRPGRPDLSRSEIKPSAILHLQLHQTYMEVYSGSSFTDSSIALMMHKQLAGKAPGSSASPIFIHLQNVVAHDPRARASSLLHSRQYHNVQYYVVRYRLHQYHRTQ